MRWSSVLGVFCLLACDDASVGPSPDGRPPADLGADATPARDGAAVRDAAPPPDGARPRDAGLRDAAPTDAASPRDAASRDAAAPPRDAAPGDATPPRDAGRDEDAAPVDAARLDAAPVDADPADAAPEHPDAAAEACPREACGFGCADPEVCGDCGDGVCQDGEACPADCCDVERCDPAAGDPWPAGDARCLNAPDGAACLDDDPHNGAEACFDGRCRREPVDCRCPATARPSPAVPPRDPTLEPPPWIGEPPREESFTQDTALRQIDLSGAWARTRGDPAVRVAIVDTGCAEIADLVGQVVAAHDVISGQDEAPDHMGHGTFMASVVAGLADGQGVVGVAPGVKLVCVRVSQGFGAGHDHIAAGIDAATAAGARVILVGFAGGTSSGLLRDAVARAQAADVLVVAPAGSDGGAQATGSPARLPGVLSVGGLSPAGLPDNSGDLGPDTRVGAPGTFVLGAHLNGAPIMRNGSSVAAAIVAGVAALVRSADPELEALDVARLLEATGHPLPRADFARAFSTRRIDARAAVEAAFAGEAALEPGWDTGLVEVQPGSPARLELEVRNRGARASDAAEVVVSARGGTIATPGGPAGLELRLPIAALPIGGVARLPLIVTGGGDRPAVELTARVGEAQRDHRLPLASGPRHRLAIRRFGASPQPEGLAVEVEIENTGTTPEPATRIELFLQPAPAEVRTLPVPALAPGARARLELLFEDRDARRAVGARLRPPSGGDVAWAWAFLPPADRLLAGVPVAPLAYMQHPGENIIIDAPWRIEPERTHIPLLIFYARTQWVVDCDPRAPCPPRLWMGRVEIRNPVGPHSGVGDLVAWEEPWHHALQVADGVEGQFVIDEDEAVLPTPSIVPGEFPPEGAQRLLFLRRGLFQLTGPGTLPDRATGGAFIEVTFDYMSLFGPVPGGGRTRKMLGVSYGIEPMPRFDGPDDAYLDPHFHTVAEWYRGDALTGPSKAYGGPLIMAAATAWALGWLETPALAELRDRVVTTDHNTFFDDRDAPPGPGAVERWGDGAVTGSPEFDLYLDIFGNSAGEEVTLLGTALPEFSAWKGRHALVYEASAHIDGDWNFMDAVQAPEADCVPTMDNLLRRMACSAGGQLGQCLGGGRGRRCIGGFTFAAHPTAAGFEWGDDLLREAMAVPAPDPTVYVAEEGEPDDPHPRFVFRGEQFWNARTAQTVESGIVRGGDLRDINPFPGAEHDALLTWWAPWEDSCNGEDGYRTKVRRDTKSFMARLHAGLDDYHLRGGDADPRPSFFRKAFFVGASDAHGDFNYMLDICASQAKAICTLIGMNMVTDAAFGRPRTYVFGAPDTSPLRQLAAGRAVATDGPVLEVEIDGEARSGYDAATGVVTWGEAGFADSEGRIGGGGPVDGEGTVLAPMLVDAGEEQNDPELGPFSRLSQRVAMRARCLNSVDFGGQVPGRFEVFLSGDPVGEVRTICVEGPGCDDARVIPLDDPLRCDGEWRRYLIALGEEQQARRDPLALVAHLQIGADDACPEVYDAWANPIWVAPVVVDLNIEAPDLIRRDVFFLEMRDRDRTLAVTLGFPISMANDLVEARIMWVHPESGELELLSGGTDGEGGLERSPVVVSGRPELHDLETGWGHQPILTPEGALDYRLGHRRLYLRIPPAVPVFGPRINGRAADDETFVLVVHRARGEDGACPDGDCRLRDAFGNPLGILAVRFGLGPGCQPRQCPRDWRFCCSADICARAFVCPPGAIAIGGCECCTFRDPLNPLRCVVCEQKRDVFRDQCPGG